MYCCNWSLACSLGNYIDNQHALLLTGQAYLKGMTICPLVSSSPPPPPPLCPWCCSNREFPPKIPVLPDPKVQAPFGMTRAWYSLRQAWKKVSHWSLAEQRCCPPLAWRSQQSPVCRSPCGFWKCRIWSSNMPTAHTACGRGGGWVTLLCYCTLELQRQDSHSHQHKVIQ